MKKFKKRILSFTLATCMVASSMTAVVGASSVDQFTDFPDNWSTQALTAAVNNGLLHGYEDNTIRSAGLLTRAEMATIMNNAFGSVIKADISEYKDVSPDAWYYEEIAKGVNMRTFMGAGGGYMYPNNTITREETFAVIARALVLSSDDTASLDKFVDKDSISSWAVSSVAALAERGYVNGDENLRLTPKNSITRAEFAVLMDNIFKEYYIKEGTYTGVVEGSLMVNVPGVKLSNLVINGDLIVGDGVHIGEIYLENVTINGRIVVRGAQKPGKVTIIKSAISGGVVVNNVNGTVYFDNYQTELVFKDIVSNTPAEFKKPTGGGGGGGHVDSGSDDDPVIPPVVPEKRTVTFVYEIDLNGNPTRTQAYSVVKDSTLASLGTTTNPFVMPNAGQTYTNKGNSTNTYSHTVNQVGWYNASKVKYDENTRISNDVTLYPGWMDFSTKATTTRFEVGGVNGVEVGTYYEPEGRVIDAASDLVFANRPSVMTALNKTEGKIFTQPFAQRFIEYTSADGSKRIKMVNLDMSFKDLFGSTASFKALFQSQIDTALGYVPEDSRAAVEAKIDDAIKQIAEDKVWKLKVDNTVELNMPLNKIYGSEAKLKEMLTNATKGVLDSLEPGENKDAIEAELEKVIDFIAKSDKNAVLPRDKKVSYTDTMLLKEFFGGEGDANNNDDGFEGMLWEEAQNAINSANITDLGLKGKIETAIRSVVHELAIRNEWSVNGTYATKTIPISLTLNNLVGDNAELENRMNTALSNALAELKNSDSELANTVETEIKKAIHKLAYKQTWTFDDADGMALITVNKAVKELLDNDPTKTADQVMTELIMGKIEAKLADCPTDLKNEVLTPIRAVVETLVENDDSWQIGNTNGIATVGVNITLDDVLGEGVFETKVKNAINTQLAKLPEGLQGQISGKVTSAVDSILTKLPNGLTNEYNGGKIAPFKLKLTPQSLFGNNSGSSFEDQMNAEIDSILNGVSDEIISPSTKNEIHAIVTTLINTVTWDKSKADYKVDVTANMSLSNIFDNEESLKSFISSNTDSKIDSFGDKVTFKDSSVTVHTIKRYIEDIALADTWSCDPSGQYNNIEASAKIAINELIDANKIEEALENDPSSDYNKLSDENKQAVVGAVGNLLNEETWSKDNANGLVDLNYPVPLNLFIDTDSLDIVGLGIFNEDEQAVINAITGNTEFLVTVNNRDLVEELKNQLEGLNIATEIDSITDPDIVNAIAIFTKAEVVSAIEAARDTYVAALGEAIDWSNPNAQRTVKSQLDSKISYNINELFLDAMMTKLGDVNYSTDIAPKIESVTALVGSLQTQIEGKIQALISGIDDVLNDQVNSVSSDVEFDISLNLTKVVLTELLKGIQPKTYNDVVNSSLQNFLPEGKFNERKTQYENEINAVIAGTQTSMSSGISFTENVNIAQIMIEKLYAKVAGLNYSDLGISADDEKIIGENIKNTFNTIKQDYVDRIATARDGDGVELVNEVEFNIAEINANKLFLDKMYTEIKSIDYEADGIENKLKALLGEDLIAMVGGSTIVKNKFNSAKASYENKVKNALDDTNGEASVGDCIAVETTVDITKELLEGLRAEIKAYKFETVESQDFKDVIGKLPDELVEFVGKDALLTALQNAQSDYVTRIDNAINNNAEFENNLIISITVNVNEILFTQMKDEIDNIAFSTVRSYIVSHYGGESTIELIGGDSVLQDAFDEAKRTYKAKIDAACATPSAGGQYVALDRNVAFDLNVNFVKIIMNELHKKLNTYTYADIKEEIEKKFDSLTLKVLEDILPNKVQEAIDDYESKALAVVNGSSTEFDTSYRLVLDVNVTDLVLVGLMMKLEELEYSEAEGMISQDLKDLIDDPQYIEEQFEIAKDTLYNNIDTAYKSNQSITGTIFHFPLELDVYYLLLKKMNAQIGNMSYDSISGKIPQQLIKLLGEELIEEQYNKVIGDFKERVETAVNDKTTEELDCSLKIVINPIDEVIIPLYNRYLNTLTEKMGVYYTGNTNLVEIQNILKPDALLIKESVAEEDKEVYAGYKLKTYDEYYDMLEKVVLLSDGAINKFSQDAKAANKVEELVTTYIDLAYSNYDRVIELMKTALEYTGKDNINIDSILPSKEALESKKETAKTVAIELANNPDLKAGDAIKKGLSLTGLGYTWNNFEHTVQKSKETITVKNRTRIPFITETN